jgi:hypothetical protein
MVSILISAAAYEAIRATFPDAQRAPPAAGDGEMIRIWLERPIVAKLNQMREEHESLSDVIIRTVRSLG